MRANLNRGIVIFTSILVGLVIGLFAAAYIYHAWVPADAILHDAPPKYLRYTGDSPQYRDFYAARAATKYQSELSNNAPDPLANAFAELGVTTGDATIDEAIAMVRGAERVAVKENSVDGDAGFFTKNDELALGALGSALEAAKAAKTYPIIDFSKYQPATARTQERVIGLALLVLLGVLGGLIIYAVDRRVGPRVAPVTTINQTFRVAPSATPHEPPQGAAPSSVTINVNPTSPGTPATSVFTAPARAAVANAPVETPIATFAPTVYRHGDDHYDEDFAINGPMGELVGECGASIADRLGVDTPARVCALSLWVFDKNDFQSTTKVLMTDYAWNDPVIRTKLKARGDAVLATEGGVVEILTSTLRVEVQVSDLSFNSDNNPPRGYFQSVTLTFSVYNRQPSA
jgi:hypothetical protein